jgi:hypothetical protein
MEGNIEMALQETEFDCVDEIHVARGRAGSSRFVCCLIVVPLPPGENPFAVNNNNNNMIMTIRGSRKAGNFATR